MSQEMETLLKEADAHLQSKEWALAQEKYERALEADPQSEEACRKLTEVYAVLGLFPRVQEMHLKLMEILEAQGDLASAADMAVTALKLNPRSVDVRKKLIQIYRAQGKAAEATDLAMHLSRLLITLGESDNAIMLLQEIHEKEPDNLEMGLELAEAYIQHGHIPEGIGQYHKIAEAYLSKEEYAPAAQVYARMKVVQAEDLDLLFTLGNLYVNLGRFDDAESEFRAILRRNLDNIKVLSALANVCQLKGQPGDAILAYRKILAISPQDETAKERLEALQSQAAAAADNGSAS